MYHLPRGRGMPLYVSSPVDGVTTVAMATVVVMVVVKPVMYNHTIKHSRTCNSRNDLKNDGINTIWLQISQKFI